MIFKKRLWHLIKDRLMKEVLSQKLWKIILQRMEIVMERRKSR